MGHGTLNILLGGLISPLFGKVQHPQQLVLPSEYTYSAIVQLLLQLKQTFDFLFTRKTLQFHYPPPPHPPPATKARPLHSVSTCIHTVGGLINH